MNCAAIMLIASIVVASSASGAGSEARDGSFWAELPENQKLTYVVGFMDGAEAVHEKDDLIDFYALALQTEKKTEGAYMLAQFVQSEAHARLASIQVLNSIKVGQYKDGLNAFYSDYRNRLIHISHAFFLVAESAKGTPADEIEKQAMAFRKKDAADTPSTDSRGPEHLP